MLFSPINSDICEKDRHLTFPVVCPALKLIHNFSCGDLSELSASRIHRSRSKSDFWDSWTVQLKPWLM